MSFVPAGHAGRNGGERVKILLLTWACDRDDVSEPAIAYRWVREIANRHEVVLFAVSRPDRFGCVREQFPDLVVHEWRDIWAPRCLERFRAVVKPGYFFYFRKARKFVRNLVHQDDFNLIHHLNPFAWRYPSPAYGLGLPLVRGPLAGGLPTPAPMRGEISEALHPYKFLRFTDAWRKKWDWRLNNAYRHTDCILAAAPYVLDLLKPLPVKRSAIEIEHGLTIQQSRRTRPEKGGVNNKVELLFVGRLIRTKGVRDAIRAVAKMETRTQVRFTIIGDGEDMEACRTLVTSLGLGELVEFRGWCVKEAVEAAYDQADIFLFPSFREPTGGVLLEAMAHSLPCVTCDYGGPAYMVAEGCGFKVPPAEPERFALLLAKHLDVLVNDPTMRQAMAQSAQGHAIQNFDWSKKMARIDALYRSLSRMQLCEIQ